MNFIQLAKNSLNLVWKQRSMWLFGFFAIGGGAAANNNITRRVGGASAGEFPTWLWPVIAVALVLGVIALVMHVFSEAALIDGVRRATNDSTPSFKTGFESGRKHFMRGVGVKVLLGVASAVAASLMAAPAVLGIFHVIPPWLAVVASVPLIIAGVPVLLSLQFVTLFALRVVVIDDVGVAESMARARKHLQGRVLDSVKLLLVALAGQAAGMAVTVVCLLPGVAVGAVVFAFAGLVPAVVTGVVVAAPLAAMALGATGALRSTVWTMGFLEGRAEELS